MLALGLAPARPDREVIAFNGDGCMLMSLGCLVTIVASGAQNLTLVVLENGVYEVTGGQHTAGAVSESTLSAPPGRPASRAWPASRISTFGSAAQPRRVALPGPRVIVLEVARVADYELSSPGPMAEAIKRFQAALGVT